MEYIGGNSLLGNAWTVYSVLVGCRLSVSLSTLLPTAFEPGHYFLGSVHNANKQ